MTKGDDRREQLLSVALDEFTTKGFYGTSTREIGRRANVSSGLLFHYFPTKESIYLELVTMGTQRMKVDFDLALMNPKMYVYQMVKGTLEQLECNPFFAKMFVFMDRVQHTIVDIKEVKELLEQVEIQQWIQVIKRGQEMECFCEGDAHALSVLLLGALQGVAQEKVRKPETPLPKVEWFMKIIEKEN